VSPAQTPPPTLVQAFEKWPDWLDAFSDFHGNRWSKAQVDACLTWAIGDDWKDVRFDLVPQRLMQRLGMAIPLEAHPIQTLKAVAEKYWYVMWTLATHKPEA